MMRAYHARPHRQRLIVLRWLLRRKGFVRVHSIVIQPRYTRQYRQPYHHSRPWRVAGMLRKVHP